MAPPELRAQLDVKIFVETDLDEALARRIERDRAGRGYSEVETRRNWNTKVLPGYEQFVAPTRSHADFIIRGTAHGKADVLALAERVKPLLSRS